MFSFAMRAASGYAAISRWYPSNLAIAWLRTRGGLKWGAPVSTVAAVGYFTLATWLAWIVAEQGAPGWVGVFACVALISAVKFAVFAPLALVLLTRAKLVQRRQARLASA
ncbi:MAG: hypothetical protein AB7K08_13745 [Microbacteriaceae bacterium]